MANIQLPLPMSVNFRVQLYSFQQRTFVKMPLSPSVSSLPSSQFMIRVLTAKKNLIRKNWPCNYFCSLCQCLHETTKHLLT
jgi:hypothetical protein